MESCIGQALVFFSVVAVASGSEWGYEGDTGPSHWAEVYPECGGVHQSPVDIEVANTQFSYPGELEWYGYNDTPTAADYEMTNNGHSVEVSVPDTAMVVWSGALTGAVYKLSQFHFHWGSHDEVGSEHTVDGNPFAAEMHLVHYNTDYGDFSSAADKSDGIAVISVPIQVGDDNEAEFELVTDYLSEVVTAGSSIDVTPFPIGSLLPSNLDDYYYYKGSLTTPVCYESVTWIIFKEPVSLSEKQLRKFRELQANDGSPLVNNFRPTQPLNDRVVYTSF